MDFNQSVPAAYQYNIRSLLVQKID